MELEHTIQIVFNMYALPKPLRLGWNVLNFCKLFHWEPITKCLLLISMSQTSTFILKCTEVQAELEIVLWQIPPPDSW